MNEKKKKLFKVGFSWGHGGVLHDNGAKGKVLEFAINKEVVQHILRLSKIDGLIEAVHCNKEPLFYFKNQNEDMAYKCKKANDNLVHLYVEIHHNAGGGQGAEVFAISKDGTSLAREVLNELVNGMGFIDRGVKNKSFYVLRNTDAPAILIEGWFVDSSKDYERYLKYGAEYEAEMILKGVYDYLGLRKPTIAKPKEYVVKKGDTLFGISRKLGVTVDYICEKNNIQNKNLIRIGQTIKY